MATRRFRAPRLVSVDAGPEQTLVNSITAAVKMKSAARVTVTLPSNHVLPAIGFDTERRRRVD